MARSKVGKTVESLSGSLGDYLREQRVSAHLSLRQLAEQTGVSNPYLSQIERGLRKPSAEVLQQLAKALRISAEQVYVQAGILNPEDEQVRSVELAILADPVLSERQKQSLLDVYQSFRALSTLAAPDTIETGANTAPEAGSKAGSGSKATTTATPTTPSTEQGV